VITIPAEVVSEVETILEAHIGQEEHPVRDRDGDDRRHKYWDMTRELKGVGYMASLPGYLIVPIIQKVLQARGCSLVALGYDSEDEAIDDLECLWDKVKLAMNEAPLEAAVRMAKRRPLHFETRRISPTYQRFLNIGYYLQEMRGDDYISLPTEPLGRILGVDPSRVTDYRGYGMKEGYLMEMAKSCYRTDGLPGVATKFRFQTDGKATVPAPVSLHLESEKKSMSVETRSGSTHKSHLKLKAIRVIQG